MSGSVLAGAITLSTLHGGRGDLCATKSSWPGVATIRSNDPKAVGNELRSVVGPAVKEPPTIRQLTTCQFREGTVQHHARHRTVDLWPPLAASSGGQRLCLSPIILVSVGTIQFRSVPEFGIIRNSQYEKTCQRGQRTCQAEASSYVLIDSVSRRYPL